MRVELQVKRYLIDMKRLLFIIFIAAVLYGCKVDNTPPIKEIEYITIRDTIYNSTAVEELVAVKEQLRLTRDSLNYVRDSIGEDLFVAKYKLARISRYVDIVDRNNKNQKYLKGWIKRALKD